MVKKDIVELLKKRGIYKDISEATLNKKTKKDLENLLNQDEPLDFGQLTTETTTISGSTYSQAHYDEYNRTGDKNIFEEVIDKMMLDGYPQEFKDKVMSMSLKEKRMAILSLLDKDRNLFMKIKSLVGTDVSKMEHIKDVVSMLRAYVKVGEVERKQFGEVMTPLELVKEMLATLPTEVWSNPDLKWLDSCNGAGAFLAMVTWRLMEGLKEWEPDHDKRYKHIVENMIYAGELQPKNMFLWMCLADPLDEFKLNVYTGSFLESGFDKHMKDVWGLEKFDIVVGNPPYNQMIDMDFLSKSHDISDIILYVHPATWLLDEKCRQKKFINTKKKVGNDLINIKLFNGNSLFGIVLAVPCVISYINKNMKHDGIVSIDKIRDIEVIYDNLSQINKFSDLLIYPKLKDRIVKKALAANLLQFKGVINGKYYVNISQITGNCVTNSNKSMVKDDFYTMITKNYKIENISKQQTFAFETQEEADNFLLYLKSRLARFCLSIFKVNKNIHRGELAIIPWLDFKKKWTDEELCVEFNLTKEEKDFIYNNIPVYYN